MRAPYFWNENASRLLTSSINILHTILLRIRLKLELKNAACIDTSESMWHKLLYKTEAEWEVGVWEVEEAEGRRWSGGRGGVDKLKRPNPCRDWNAHLKVRKVRGALWDCWQAETSCHAPAALLSETLESPTCGEDEGFWTLLNFSAV